MRYLMIAAVGITPFLTAGAAHANNDWANQARQLFQGNQDQESAYERGRQDEMQAERQYRNQYRQDDRYGSRDDMRRSPDYRSDSYDR